MKFVVPLLSLVFSPTLFVETLAADQPQVLDPLIIHTSRIPTLVDQSMMNVVIIDRESIDSSQASSIAELLRFQAGVHIQQNGSRGAVGSIYLRNNDPNYLAVIIDGVKVNDPTNSRGGSFDFSSIDINSVERIEIVKGAMSSTYGSDALAGVIYVTTRAVKDDNNNRIRVTTGTNKYNEGMAQAQQRMVDTDISLAVSYLDEGEQTGFSGFINRSVNISTDTYLDNETKFSARGRYNESDARYLPDDSGGEDFAVIREVDQRGVKEAAFALNYMQDVTPAWRYSLEASKFNHHERVNSPGVAAGVRPGVPVNTSVSDLTREYLLWSNNVEINSEMQVNLGLDRQWEQGVSEGTINTMISPLSRLKRQTQGVFAEALQRFNNNFSVKIGLRHDDPKGNAAETTGNLGFMYQRSHYVYTASFGTGYKLPSFFALGNFIVGNPDLKPEESKYWELGLKSARGNNKYFWHVNVYAYEFKNLIDFDLMTFSMVNRGQVTSEGVELGYKQYIFNNNSISIELHYSETDIIGSNAKLRNRPRWRATGQYKHSFTGATSGLLSLVYVDDVYESSIPTGDVILDSYYRFDVSLNWRYSKMWTISGVIENVTDEDYQETVGTDSPGFSIRASIRATF